MGLPQLDFRVPESTWFKSVFAGRFGVMPGLSASGTLAWPYKIAVVAVMTLVAGGTLVTFGSAGAETPTSAEISALPGSDEASPTVEGQVLPPPSTSLLNGADLLSSLNLTDYSPGDSPFGLSNEDEDDEDSDDGDDDSDDENEDAEKKPTSTPSSSGDGGSTDGDSDDEEASPSPTPTEDPEPVEGAKHKQWSSCTSSDLNVKLRICGPEPDFES